MSADPNDKGSTVIEEIPIDAIEPDPAQPRRAFDEEKLRALAESIHRHGLLQEPGVIAVDAGGGGSARYRLIWGERRWRACALAGLKTVRCRVLPRGSEGADHELRLKDKQWAENMERESLSPIEEAIAIQDAVELRRRGDPSAADGDLAEKIGAERGLNATVARQLLGLLKAPRSLQRAMLDRAIGREVGFELARYWNKLVAQDEEQWVLRREIQFRNLVLAWAAARGHELDASSMAKYAAETFQDLKVVKATCQKAEQAGRKLVERFDAVVARAVREKWTVSRAKSRLRDRSRSVEPGYDTSPAALRADGERERCAARRSRRPLARSGHGGRPGDLRALRDPGPAHAGRGAAYAAIRGGAATSGGSIDGPGAALALARGRTRTIEGDEEEP